jgi:hypothetical protein
MIKYSRTVQKLVNNAECHTELVSASNKIIRLGDSKIIDPELDSGHGSG